MSSGNFNSRTPSDVFTVGLPADEATMKDGDETITEGAKSLMMCLATPAQ